MREQPEVIGQIADEPAEQWRAFPMPAHHLVLGPDELPEARYSPSEFRRICRGFVPREMEDKWFVHAEDDRVYFHRSWTGFCIYVAEFRRTGRKHQLVRLTVNRDPEQYQQTDARFDALLCKYLIDALLLGREATFPSDPADSEEDAALKMWSMVGQLMLMPLNRKPGPRLDSQVIEILGRNRLVDEILRAGLEVALPARDRGIDLIAYADVDSRIDAFVACPIQMKAASAQTFSIDAKYARIANLLLAHIWHVNDPRNEVTYVMTYAEALQVADAMGWTKTDSWRAGSYATTRPSVRLQELLEPHLMTAEKWWEKVVG